MFDLGDGIPEGALLDVFWLLTMMSARDDALPGHLRNLHICAGGSAASPKNSRQKCSNGRVFFD